MQVDIIFDPVCPWCFIGKRRLERAMAMRPHISVERRWRPFLLNPDLPGEGIDRTAYLLKKFGSEARVRRVYGAIAEAGQSVEIDFGFDRIEQTPNTVNAHRLLLYARNFDKADEMVETLFQSYFLKGENIGRHDVLMAIGVKLGLPRDNLDRYLSGDKDVDFIHEENTRAHRLGVNGVPSYVLESDMVISGAQEPPVLARLLDAAAQMAINPATLDRATWELTPTIRSPVHGDG